MQETNLKYYIETWGCQMNEEDSEKLSGMLKNIGYSRTETKEEAGIILVVLEKMQKIRCLVTLDNLKL